MFLLNILFLSSEQNPWSFICVLDNYTVTKTTALQSLTALFTMLFARSTDFIQCRGETSSNIQSVGKCWYATEGRRLWCDDGWRHSGSCYKCFGPYSVGESLSTVSGHSFLCRDTMNTVDLVSLQNVAVVWAFYIHLCSCDRDLWLGRFVRRFCLQCL